MYPASRPSGRALACARSTRTPSARLPGRAALAMIAALLIPSARAAAQDPHSSTTPTKNAPRASAIVATAQCVGVPCPARVDPARDSIRKTQAPDSSAETPKLPRTAISRRGPLIFVGAVGAALVANSVVHLDNDPGGYRDSWNSEASFPDKAVHGLAAFAITSVGVDLKVRPVYAALTTCAAGAIFETTQGYVSPYDIAADCVGAGLAGLWRHWRAR
jgi:hypothetical protein